MLIERLLASREVVKGSTSDGPSGRAEVNNLQETNRASPLFWFSFRQCDAQFPSPLRAWWRETVPGSSSSPSLGQGGRKSDFFFTPLFARWLTHMVRKIDFSPQRTDLLSGILNPEFPESSASNPFPVGRRPLLVSPGIAALL